AMMNLIPILHLLFFQQCLEKNCVCQNNGIKLKGIEQLNQIKKNYMKAISKLIFFTKLFSTNKKIIDIH
ncbi:MAG: hypothetical protein ACTHKC_06940, partial [Candidatus Nitrosocosmicus sp.]